MNKKLMQDVLDSHRAALAQIQAFKTLEKMIDNMSKKCGKCGISKEAVKMSGDVCAVCFAKAWDEPHYDNSLDQDEPERENPSVEEERDFNTL